jgi:AraC family transcriptional activator of pobA
LANLKIASFDGLYGDHEGKFSSEYIFLELIATRSQIFDWNIKPHVHSHLFQVFIIEKGTLEFTNISSKSRINAPCIIVIPPTLLHGLVYSPDVEGQILSLSDNIVNDIFKTSSAFLNSCEKIQIIEKFEELNSFANVLNILENLKEELFSEQEERNILLKALISQFFVKLLRMFDMGLDLNKDSTMANYYRKFQKNIKNAVQNKSVPQFAEELNISSVHLNRICQSMSGKSAIEIIHQNTIIEAQKYLLHTSYSISEIAYLLHFEYPNYFAKMFKKYVGLSPVEFRRLDRK